MHCLTPFRALIAGLAFAVPLTGNAAEYGAGCEANMSCTQSPGCNCSQPPHQPCGPPQGVPPPQSPFGFFQAPPPTGTVQGPIEGAGVQGAEITFPELRLRFPTLRFPSHFRSRTGARMITESGVAPFVEGQSVQMGVTVQPNNPQGVPPPGGPPRQGAPPPCDMPVPPQGVPPACDTSAHARLDALEHERQQLEQRLMGLQQILANSAAPRPVMGLAPVAGLPLTEPQLSGTPIRQPAPSTQQGASIATRPGRAQPASFFEEAGPAVTSRAPIREPAPAARITALR